MANTYDILKDLCYGDLLATPGYDVDYAVGTTYSLDLKLGCQVCAHNSIQFFG